MTKHLRKIYQLLLEEYGLRNKWFGETADEIIIGAILTQNTNWTNVEKALANLRTANLLSLDTICKMEPSELANYIRPSGYHNQKSVRMISIANALTNDVIPQDPAEFRKYLLSLKGIGPETADCILLYAHHIPVFVIDAYTIRIFNRLGLCSDKVTYHDLQNWFMQYLPYDTKLYNEYHALIIKHAKVHCLKKPMCTHCPLQDLCNYAKNIAE
jgi:endonuclease-3 related protein